MHFILFLQHNWQMVLPRREFRALSWASQFLAYKQPAWKCASYRNVRLSGLGSPRRFATTAAVQDEVLKKKPYYVTTPIFYVNACELFLGCLANYMLQRR